MKILQHQQGSEEWLKARIGIPTASEFSEFMIEQKTATAKKAYTKYIIKKITESFPKDEFEQEAEQKAARFMDLDPWVQRGKALEPEARMVLSSIIEREIVETGMILHECGFGASPDGLILTDDGNDYESGCEIKCHNLTRHLTDVLVGTLPDDHKLQVHGCMAVTGLQKWHYFGYYPNQPFLHVIVHRDETTDKLESGLKTLVAEKAKMKAKLAQMWEVKP